ncbi:hypothetical protein [Vulcanisaeta sp. JCM 14467]|uniref:hypothetical protein n=1 Tax=Vulcanisaeta sp. JCM 14467 TaxID=1295370 RepID=UPI000AEB62C6|nr:hypothetical protein [Vulcanisaeta sp. JCM 14467]
MVRCVKSGNSCIVNAAFTNIWKPIILEVGNDGLRSISIDCQEIRRERVGGPSILDFMK